GSIPPQIVDSRNLEIAWTVLPIVTILGLFGLTLVALGQVDARAVSPRVTVDVTAYRWQWRFDYEGTAVSVAGGPDQPAEMVVPVGEPVHIVLTSVDVAHSFFVPAFLFKRDAIPGHPNEFDVTIDEPGVYDRHVEFRSEEHTSELQSRGHLVCRLLLEKKKNFN